MKRITVNMKGFQGNDWVHTVVYPVTGLTEAGELAVVPKMRFPQFGDPVRTVGAYTIIHVRSGLLCGVPSMPSFQQDTMKRLCGEMEKRYPWKAVTEEGKFNPEDFNGVKEFIVNWLSRHARGERRRHSLCG